MKIKWRYINCIFKVSCCIIIYLSKILENNFDRTFLCNSEQRQQRGSKIAYRYYENKKFVLSSDKSYHGKLIAT